MADSAIAVGAGGGGAGGGGIAFNTPRDIFNGATRAAAEALRDSTITDTAPWDDDPILGIILTWPVVVTDTIYQVRRSGQWVDVDVLVEGDDGDGATGPSRATVPHRTLRLHQHRGRANCGPHGRRPSYKVPA